MKVDWVEFFMGYVLLALISIVLYEMWKNEALWPVVKLLSFIFVPPTIAWAIYNKFSKD